MIQVLPLQPLPESVLTVASTNPNESTITWVQSSTQVETKVVRYPFPPAPQHEAGQAAKGWKKISQVYDEAHPNKPWTVTWERPASEQSS
jgi:hypothetical protein